MLTRVKTISSLIAVAAMVWVVHPADAQQSTLDKIKERGVLIAGPRADLPPLGSLNAKGEFEGLDVDVYKLLAERLGVKLELRAATSQTMIPMLLSGAIDIGPSATASKKREEVVDFTIIAFWDAGKVLVRKDSPIKRLEDLKGKNIGIVHGSYYGTALKERFPNDNFTTYPEYPQALAALQTGKVDATPLTWSSSAQILKERPTLVALEDDILKDPMAYPVRENDSKWRDWLNTTLQELWKAGTYKDVLKKHFGTDPTFSLWSQYGLQPGI